VFIPPYDSPEPIPVPTEIRTQCLTDASRYFGIDPEIAFTLYDNEGGKVGSFIKNKNGSYDIGPMQINSSNLNEIKKHFPAVTWKVLAYDACASFWVGTWWLYRKIVDRNGNVFEGVADYNSRTPKVRARYIFKFMERYNRRIQMRNGMHELNTWAAPVPNYNGHLVENVTPRPPLTTR